VGLARLDGGRGCCRGEIDNTAEVKQKVQQKTRQKRSKMQQKRSRNLDQLNMQKKGGAGNGGPAWCYVGVTLVLLWCCFGVALVLLER
jgi:hypothetical protein